MKIQKVLAGLLTLLVFSLLIVQCNTNKNDATESSNAITPVELPVTIPDFHYPEDSNVIYGWMNDNDYPNKYDSASVYEHAWGIWAGLTTPSGQTYAGDSLLVYETWLGISDIRQLIIDGESACGEKVFKKTRSLLEVPRQFQHGFKLAERVRAMSLTEASATSNPLSFWVTVAYDPNAACYATNNKILKESVLNGFMNPGAVGHIPAFPQKAITLKPSYYVGSEKDGLIKIPVWPGPPNPATAYPTSLWPDCVYADVANKQQPGKKLAPVAKGDTDPAHIAAATCNLNDFINFKVDQQMASYMNAQDSTEGVRASAGQIAILVAMHVTSKEISNWTWQTFYWAPDPDQPYAPSSIMAASLRPPQLYGAASHYAVTTAYAMVLPNQPLNGGTNTGVIPMLGYNPYLEAPFGDDVFSIQSILIPGKRYGVQTNCMSCHGLATSDGSIGYSTDQYFSVDSSLFNNKVLLDFAWSIQGNLIKDTTSGSR